jgi:creatinine amidohydrolase/Fe(II)-dependent formamide hydrolase-like protein
MHRAPIVLVALALPLALPNAAGAQQDAAEEARRLREDLARARPIEAVESLWIEQLTWMEVRDALAAGSTTAIVPTGGVEQNGPYLVTGKHNVVLQGACEMIARELGDALCAPILALVPEGDVDGGSGHMRYPGTISLREETFRMVLEDVGRSLAAHGFTDIVFIGDSGGNQRGMEAVADLLNERWAGTSTRAHFVPEFYTYADVLAYMEEDLGVVQTVDEGLHDDFAITSMMMVVDPGTVRYQQRVAAGLASINGVSIAPLEEAVRVGRELFAFRATRTAEAIRTARLEARR